MITLQAVTKGRGGGELTAPPGLHAIRYEGMQPKPATRWQLWGTVGVVPLQFQPAGKLGGPAVTICHRLSADSPQ